MLRIIAILFLSSSGLLLLGGGLVYLASKRTYKAAPADAVIVLGGKINPDQSPSNTLKNRLEAAEKAFYASNAKIIIVTGGQGMDEPEPESKAMKRYLIQKGVPENRIHEDPDSKNTIENMKNAKKILTDCALRTAVIATTDYHIPRSLLIAKRLNIPAAPAPSKPARRKRTRIMAYTREAISWGLLIMKIAAGRI